MCLNVEYMARLKRSRKLVNYKLSPLVSVFQIHRSCFLMCLLILVYICAVDLHTLT